MENTTSLEQFVQMTAMIHATNKDFARMYAHFGIDETTWHGIAAHWMSRITQEPQLAEKFQTLMKEELARLQSSAAVVR